MDAERLDLYRKIQPLIPKEWKTENPELIKYDKASRTLSYVPPVYDPEHPERSLWGMVDWEDWCLIAKEDGTVDIHNNQDIYTGKLDIALLKAIIRQKEEEDGY